jgi:carbonic anhydrase
MQPQHTDNNDNPLRYLLNKNKEWADASILNDPDFFQRHATGQHPRLIWIGCSDSRVPSEQILCCGPGELFVHRNVANIVAYNDVSLATVLQYGIEHLAIDDIVVCGHYECGGIAAACESKPIGDGYLGDWLMIAKWAQRLVDNSIGDENGNISRADYLRLVVEENIRLQIKHLSHLNVVKKSWEKRPGIPRLHGWVYDIHTGLIKIITEVNYSVGV